MGAEGPWQKEIFGEFLSVFFRTWHAAQKENLSGKETQAKDRDFTKFFALTFLHKLLPLARDLNWMEEISQRW